MSIGKVKLYADLHDFIFDPYLLQKIKAYDEDRSISNKQDDEKKLHLKAGLRAIISYHEGGYFGDSDVLTLLSGLSNNRSYETTAIGEMECTLFIMSIREIRKIRDQFADIYESMLELAIKRYKNHKILIKKEVDLYIDRIHLDESCESHGFMEHK